MPVYRTPSLPPCADDSKAGDASANPSQIAISRHTRESALSKKALFTKEPLSLTDRPPPKPRKPPRKRKPRIPTTPAFSFHPSQSKVSSGLVQPPAQSSLAERDERQVLPVITVTPNPSVRLPFLDPRLERQNMAVELSDTSPYVEVGAINSRVVTTGPFVDYHRNAPLTYSNTSRDQPIVHARPEGFTLPSWLRARQPSPPDVTDSSEKPIKEHMSPSWMSPHSHLSGDSFTQEELSFVTSDLSATFIHFENVGNPVSSSSNPGHSITPTNCIPRDMDFSGPLHTSGDQVFDLTKFVPEWPRADS